MRKTAAVAWKEIRSYFSSPMAYAVAGVFVGLTGYFFVDGLSGPIPEATVRPYTDSATFVLVLLAPLLTMRLLAEEHKLGTSELLLTAPIQDWEVALGKFLASLIFFVASIALTLFYVALLYWVGNPDTGPILTAYLGLVLFAGAALSIGLFTSSITASDRSSFSGASITATWSRNSTATLLWEPPPINHKPSPSSCDCTRTG